MEGTVSGALSELWFAQSMGARKTYPYLRGRSKGRQQEVLKDGTQHFQPFVLPGSFIVGDCLVLPKKTGMARMAVSREARGFLRTPT